MSDVGQGDSFTYWHWTTQQKCGASMLPGHGCQLRPQSNPEAKFLCIESIEQIPDDLRQAFDTVYFLETLEHLPRELEYPAAKSLEKLLAPDGELILSVPAAGLAALLDPAWYLVGHRHYRNKRLVRILQSAGIGCR